MLWYPEGEILLLIRTFLATFILQSNFKNQLANLKNPVDFF